MYNFEVPAKKDKNAINLQDKSLFCVSLPKLHGEDNKASCLSTIYYET